MTPGPLLLFAGLCLASAAAGLRLGRLWLGLTLAGSGAAMAAALFVLGGAGDWEWRSRFAVAGEPLHLRLDGLSALFLVLMGIVVGAGAACAREFGSGGHGAESGSRGRFWWNMTAMGMGLVLLSSNGLHFLVAWELFAIGGYFLVGLDRGRREARAAAWLYLSASHAGTLCLFAFLGTLAARTGSWELGPMRDRVELAPLFWLALCGFGVKAGLFPLHIWLPSAHANAPSHVSALMSGMAVKMGVYGLVRFSGWLPAPAAAGWVLTAIGIAGALVGMGFAFAQNDIKRMLAYCTVENVGIIAIGLGVALLGASRGGAAWGRLALAGALLHALNHGLLKSLLFLGSGSVAHGAGTREMSRLGGLWRRMPWTAGLFALGAAAISGLPPLNGFVGEWLLYLGLFDGSASPGPEAWAAMAAVIAMAVAGALALASFTKASSTAFLGGARTKFAREARESGPWIRGSMLFLAGTCVAIGLAPFAALGAVSAAVGTWNPAWCGTGVPAPQGTLGAAHASLAILFLAGALLLWKRTGAAGARRAPTWDCGYAEPSVRMQYTGGSFSGIASAWFSWALLPERVQRRPRGAFPIRAVRRERVPEAVLEWVVEPAGRAVARVSAAARRLQHGRLQFYIAYLMCGRIVLAFLVLLERKP